MVCLRRSPRAWGARWVSPMPSSRGLQATAPAAEKQGPGSFPDLPSQAQCPPPRAWQCKAGCPGRHASRVVDSSDPPHLNSSQGHGPPPSPAHTWPLWGLAPHSIPTNSPYPHLGEGYVALEAACLCTQHKCMSPHTCLSMSALRARALPSWSGNPRCPKYSGYTAGARRLLGIGRVSRALGFPASFSLSAGAFNGDRSW